MILAQELGTALTGAQPRIHLYSARELRGDDEIVHTACDREFSRQALGIYEATRGIRPNCDACNSDMKETRMDTKATQEKDDDMDQTTPDTDDTQDTPASPDVSEADARVAQHFAQEDTKRDSAPVNGDGRPLVPKPRKARKAASADANGNGVAHTNGVHAAPAHSGLSAAQQVRDLQAKIEAVKSRAIEELMGKRAEHMTAVMGIDRELAALRGDEEAAPAPAKPRPARRAAAAKPAKAAAKPAAAKAENASKPAKAKGERLARRSPDEINAAVSKVVDLIKANQSPLRSEQIRTALKFESKEMPRILKTALAQKKLRARGNKRATEYSVRADVALHESARRRGTQSGRE